MSRLIWCVICYSFQLSCQITSQHGVWKFFLSVCFFLQFAYLTGWKTSSWDRHEGIFVFTHSTCLCFNFFRRTWGAAAWSWRHFDGRGAVLYPFSQKRRLDQWRNTITLQKTYKTARLAMVHPHSNQNGQQHNSSDSKDFFLQQFVNKMTESSAKKVYRFPSPTFMGDTHLIFAGGGRPLSHAAWVMGHLDLTLYIPLIHPFVLSKKPTKQTWRKMYAMLPNRQNFDRLDGWQKQTWHLTGLHQS